MFNGRTLLIASKHRKEQVAAPLFEKAWGVECKTCDMDTDSLGTFTGEVKRELTPLQAALKKCEMALHEVEDALAFANEGSFGPHPEVPFITADTELVVFEDKRNGLQVVEHCYSFSTNFSQSYIQSWGELQNFAVQAEFPSHALILRVSPDSVLGIAKGLSNWSELKKQYEFLQQNYKQVYAETDMRAMYNPTRMHVIKTAVEKLINRVNSRCPNCSSMGFGVTGYQSGLPCELCRLPTSSVLFQIHSCNKCGFKKELYYPKSKKYESAQYCHACNP